MESSWKFLVNPRTVTLHVFVAPGAYQPRTVEACNRGAVDGRQESDGQYVIPSGEVYWSLWAEKLGGAVPKVPDVIEDAEGRRWVIIDEVAELGHGARFRARCRLEVGG